MSRRTEVCREFRRGNCRFGSRCKFSHDTTQQPSSTFAFGVKNQGQQQSTFNKGGNYYSPLTSQTKEKTQPQISIKEHRCTDLKECKLQIKEDLENEQPIFWRLTCYAHGKYLVNDVDGDVSFEELRAHAYAVGKQGMPFDSVVQHERSMLATKKKEFDYLLNNPRSGPGGGFHRNNIPQQEPSKMSFGTAGPSFLSPPFGSSHGSTQPPQNFSQSRELLGSGAEKKSGGFSFGVGTCSGPAATTAGAMPILSQSVPVPSFSFGMRSSEPGPLVQSLSPQSSFASSSLLSSGFGQDTSLFNPSFGHSSGASHSLFGSNIPSKKFNANEVSNSLLPVQNGQLFGVANGLDTSMNQAMTEVSGENAPAGLLPQKFPGPINDKADLWLKGSWALGEIPEEEPPLYAR